MTATVTRERIREVNNEDARFIWRSLYKLGGIAALLAIVVALTDIALTFLPAGAEQPGTMTAVDWFHLFQNHWFFGLRNLGLLPNILTLLLMIPLFLSLYLVHQQENQPYAALALILAVVGTAIYLANNAAFPMWALSTKYALASDDTQRSLLAAAGEAMLARGEDFTPGAFIGFALTETATIVMSVVMLHGKVFSRVAACAGLLGGILLTLFTIWATFIPYGFASSMVLAMIGGLCSIVWYILTAHKLFQLS
ncbi:MAG: DUF4386 family protein [Anaerolineales bacterium]